jgi:arsenate reductase
MTDDEALDALVADGRLIKRPFVVAPDGQVLVGFKEEVWQAQLKG